MSVTQHFGDKPMTCPNEEAHKRQVEELTARLRVKEEKRDTIYHRGWRAGRRSGWQDGHEAGVGEGLRLAERERREK